MATTEIRKPKDTAKTKILSAAFSLVRERGYGATSVDALCEHAGITKGAFFHHFKSKEDLAIAAAEHWSSVTGNLFAHAPYHLLQDPLERLLAYVQFRKDLLRGRLPEFTCLVGTMVQETYFAHPKIRAACYESIFGHALTYEPYIEEAKAKHCPTATWSSKSLALHIQANIQGAFILAKASGNISDAVASLEHLERYLRLVFKR